MKWVRRGHLFRTEDWTLPGGCVGYAQSPQAVVMDDRVRIYFSCRPEPIDGRYVSQVAFADASLDMERILSVSPRFAVSLGELGGFDEHGIFPLSPVREGDRLLAYSTGWSRRVSVPVETAIGLLESTDGGATYARVGQGPVMAAALHEPTLVGDAFVRRFGGSLHMWYIYGGPWSDSGDIGRPARNYRIAHALSDDGIRWSRDGRSDWLVEPVLGENECQALPTVIGIDGMYHMYFCYRHRHDFRTNPQNTYRLGHAVSSDLERWIRDDLNGGLSLASEGWDSQMMCYPHVFEAAGRVHLLYNGNEFGRYGFGVATLEA